MQFNFLPQFAQAVEAYEKPFTIRDQRKREPKLGEVVHLFTGQRTKQCRKLGVAPLKFFAKIQLGWGHFSFPIPEELPNAEADEAYKAGVIAWLLSLGSPEISRFTELATKDAYTQVMEGITIHEDVETTLKAYDALARLDGFANRIEMLDFHNTTQYTTVDKWVYAWEKPSLNLKG